MKYKFHVPVQQYGFVEIEGEDEDLPDMEIGYNKYAEYPVSFKGSGGDFKKLTSFNSEDIMYSNTLHEYRSLDGKVLMGGSTYAKQFGKPFNPEAILPRCATAWKVDEQTIKDIWDMNRDVSNLLGTSIHLGLELAHKHSKAGEKIKENKKEQESNYALPKSPIVRKAVTLFVDEYGVDALPEVLVTNVAKGRAGQIDRLQVVDKDKKICRVQDFKTSAIEDDTTIVYQNQLSFYASMLTDNGWTVEGLDLFFYDGDKWTKKSLTVLKVKEN